nr:radical SAM protein [Candidatus Njordarchaeota archaeon]
MGRPQETIYEEALVKTMLHYINVRFLPFRWGANTYRGCEHDCIYCNARYTHEYLGLPTGEFAHKIIVKRNAAAVLDRDFSKEKWKKMTVNLASVTDPYQPAEGRFKITREVLEVFLKHHNPLLLTTKSDLVLRDIDVLMEIGRTGFLNVVVSLSTLDEDLRKKIEPKVPSVERRLEMIQELHKAGITVGVTAIPLLPHISDDKNNVEELVRAAREHGAEYLIADLLNFRGETRTRFREFLATYYSDLTPEYERLYQTNYCEGSYAKKIRIQTNECIKTHGLENYEKVYSFRKR